VLTVTQSEFIKKKLNLVELPGEGGFYRETYRSNFSTTHTPTRKNKSKVSQENRRPAVTLIYYLTEEVTFLPSIGLNRTKFGTFIGETL